MQKEMLALERMHLFFFYLLTIPFATSGFVVNPFGSQKWRRSVFSELSVVGPVEVDLNQYNLPFDRIVEEWTAKLLPRPGPGESPVYLATKSEKGVFIDTFTVELPRSDSIGIVLLEIAGGRQDQLGITIVSDLVEGGVAEGSEIMPGDTISRVTLSRRATVNKGNVLSDTEEKIECVTECLGYDATVSAIQNLPPVASDNEVIILTMKRLRRVPIVKVKVQYPPSQNEPDATIELFSGENLRRSLFAKGIRLTDDLAKLHEAGGPGNCGDRGICTDCAVSVIRGGELLSPPRPREKQMVEDNPRWRLSCRTFVGYGMREGELTIRVNPKQW